MFHRFKNVTLFFVLLIVVGCAGAPKLTVVSPAGDRIPNPFYTAGTTDGSHMRFTWYYVKYNGIEDLDKSIQLIPVHLDRNMSHFINRKKTHEFRLTLRVFNPRHEEYTIFVNKKIEYSDGNKIRNYFVKGRSFLEFRQWDFPYPYNKRIKKMQSFVEIRRGSDTILRTKKFSYSVE
jgi:hypothetical protein